MGGGADGRGCLTLGGPDTGGFPTPGGSRRWGVPDAGHPRPSRRPKVSEEGVGVDCRVKITKSKQVERV